jgi:hypothetical protein
MLYNMLAAGVFGRRARIPQERIPLQQIFDLLEINYEPVEDDTPVVPDIKSKVDLESLEKSIVKSTSIDEPPVEKPAEKVVEDDPFDNGILGEDNSPDVVESTAALPPALQNDPDDNQ